MPENRHSDPSSRPPHAPAGVWRAQIRRRDLTAALCGRDEADGIADPALLYPGLPPDPRVLAVFEQELLSASAPPGLIAAGPTLWPRFTGYYERLARLPRRARRALQRQWRRSLGGLALLLAFGQAPALAATINVDGTICTLVDAVTAANTNAATGGCTAGSGADTLVLSPGSTHTLTAVNNTTNGPTGLPAIASVIIIEGNGSTILRDPSAPEFRLLTVRSSGHLTLQETTVSGGLVGCCSGGGVYNLGTVSMVDSAISGNSAYFSGGGLVNSSFGTATLRNSTVSGNSAFFRGGGLNNISTVTLLNSTVSDNSAGLGGGLINQGTATLRNSTVSGNSADTGGGLYNSGTAILTLAQTLISGNTASQQNASELTRLSGTVIANDFNLFGHGGNARVSGFTPGATDIVPAATLMAILDTTLRANNGPTQTHALIAGSPAVDAVPAADCATSTDQRGVARPRDGDGDAVAECDVGAFEGVVPPPPPPPPPPLPPPPPPAPDTDTAPLGLSNPQSFGCELTGDEITCPETGATLPFIRFDVDIPENAGFLQFDYTFTGADGAVSGTEQLDTLGQASGHGGRRASVGDLGAVFIVNTPIAALPASGVLQEGVFQPSGQSGLPRSDRGIMIVTNFPSGAAGSVFRIRNLRVDRCATTCFGRRATLCGTDGRDELTGTRRNDVIVGRDGNDTVKGLSGNDLLCGGKGKDKLSGGPGDDRLDGGLGRDRCDGGRGTDRARRCDGKRGIP